MPVNIRKSSRIRGVTFVAEEIKLSSEGVPKTKSTHTLSRGGVVSHATTETFGPLGRSTGKRHLEPRRVAGKAARERGRQFVARAAISQFGKEQEALKAKAEARRVAGKEKALAERGIAIGVRKPVTEFKEPLKKWKEEITPVEKERVERPVSFVTAAPDKP